ncbi:hypothetical protein QBC46DRAFT_146565 [Diplogelasinospora grovesii]|uniref:Hikeshi-like domain-containing protein n=1 Tax=Diplogelasinospora grovesii TaxID=303347 RepID=A0AAN6S8X1_9PEZI|nr:hypothetical protein QBC46DRAFT_146565 [Diplogelasinospora grovesii]
MAQQPLFGVVPAGQPVIITPTEAPTISTFLYAIPPGSKHVVVFLLPGVVLPEGTAAAIYLVTPAGPGQGPPNPKFLGGIGPGKESAIFKVESNPNAGVVLGVSVEPAQAVAARMTEPPPQRAASPGTLVPANQTQPQQPSTLVLAQRIIKNAFNFLTSFSTTAGGVEVVPLKAFEEWWRKFESKIRADPGFLERGDD